MRKMSLSNGRNSIVERATRRIFCLAKVAKFEIKIWSQVKRLPHKSCKIKEFIGSLHLKGAWKSQSIPVCGRELPVRSCHSNGGLACQTLHWAISGKSIAKVFSVESAPKSMAFADLCKVSCTLSASDRKWELNIQHPSKCVFAYLGNKTTSSWKAEHSGSLRTFLFWGVHTCRY